MMEGRGSLVAVVLFVAALVGEGGSSNPWGSFRGESAASWDTLGSRFAAPGIALSGSWSSPGGRAVAPLSPVAVQCQEAAMVVTVQRDLFGTGKLVQAADLKLGAAFCGYTSIAADAVILQSALQDCGNTLQMTSDTLVYRSILTYNPSPSGSAVIIRSNPAQVLIQCIYPRSGNVSSNPIKPTWIPFSSTVSAEGSLVFSLRLMNDNWSSERSSNTFQLGEVFHIEASVDTGNHASMRLFVDSCVATLTPDKASSPRYDLINSNGCLVDGKLSDSSSAFRAPRSQPNVLQFSVDAFRFIGDSRSLIYITCALKAVDATQAPNAVNKACSYSGVSSSWLPVEGAGSICSCCDGGSCGLVSPPGGPRRLLVPSRRTKRAIVAKSEESVAVLGPLVILADAGKGSMIQHGAVTEPWSMVGLVFVAMAVALSFGVIGAVVLYKGCRAS
ncbi:zona pellucida sperm-binding protein 3 [Ambystoma mexicanum]|uniref:zona pellucida sperm-binding protein 3 n=1 Tax=Ambystoma mexicanum TaxID=8296 RepID=UPI0037E9A79E